ncbi:2'-5' RNA ligase family protein [Labrys sp. ZIDIC5]|uniref:2'-5' RNA ligase family protein n=1 Tax=Labrys sedimenti TaxID=3106036 RepID=UPI002ACA73F1|nr:2'-5' RNA ligase family protein [Labrys sp. ZIDIC5]MDZ5450592.1 2'-5' RNA ligase family protein [Labrys sp. ZIDIC5]
MAEGMHSVWLMPVAEDELMLATIVTELAERFGTPVFQPHLTLVEDRHCDEEELARQLEAVAAGIAPFAADIQAVGISDLFFRAFYARFERVGPVLELKRRAIASIAASPIENFMPHISLAYGVVDDPSRQAAARQIEARLKGKAIRFDHIAVVRSAQSIPIEDWAIRATIPLR